MARNAYQEVLNIKLHAKAIELIECFYNNIIDTILQTKSQKIEKNGYIFYIEDRAAKVLEKKTNNINFIEDYTFDELYNILFKKRLEE